MKKISILLLIVILSFTSDAQTILRGKVTDKNTGESLIGATIVYGKGMGTATDFDGNYSISLPNGERSIQVSYVGYKAINKIVVIENKSNYWILN